MWCNALVNELMFTGNCPEAIINSLAHGGFDYSLKLVNFKLISTINILSIFCEIATRWMPQHFTDHKSTLVQVMTWCRQATSHYLNQCWHRSMSPYGAIRPQWFNIHYNPWYSITQLTAKPCIELSRDVCITALVNQCRSHSFLLTVIYMSPILTIISLGNALSHVWYCIWNVMQLSEIMVIYQKILKLKSIFHVNFLKIHVILSKKFSTKLPPASSISSMSGRKG